MKRISTFIFVLSLAIMMFSPQEEGACRIRKNMYEMFEDAGEIKTYVQDVEDSSGDAKDILKPLKKALEDALATRMTIDFKLVDRREDAYITIGCDIVESIWQEDDPVDMITGISGIALDAIVSENYARLQAVFTVTKVKNNRVLWKQKLQATVTEKNMPKAESRPLVVERIIKVFMRRCFSRNAKQGS